MEKKIWKKTKEEIQEKMEEGPEGGFMPCFE